MSYGTYKNPKFNPADADFPIGFLVVATYEGCDRKKKHPSTKHCLPVPSQETLLGFVWL
jgi:hypothetical protein